MKKILLTLTILLATTFCLAAQPKNLPYVVEESKIDFSQYQTFLMKGGIEEQVYLYNYSSTPEAFEVLLHFEKGHYSEWVACCKTGILQPKSKASLTSSYKSPGLIGKVARTPICTGMAIRTKTGNKYSVKTSVTPGGFLKLKIYDYKGDPKAADTSW